jgi:phage FluMu protein Com
MLPLTRCRQCSSKLLQLERLWLLPDGRHVARRRCPECEAVDDVTAAPEALWAWCSEARRQRDRMERTMLELAEGVAELEPLEPLA